MKSNFDILIETHGAVITLEQLAAILSRKPEGLRMALLQPKEPWAKKLNDKKFYVGRRMYFPTETVSEVISGVFLSP
ncbi:TPA: hypothetical protein ACJ2UR_003029 [Yersinia enterocolitica]|uniref:hypothetical protein n=1 Tax=Yersinia enterocolitica TaxID=630 RepID=UPI0021E86897|nr:hypothetical protein [Yersinia enterocolitica]EKN6017286.1 hypothetical protein [Yersinia enterocolitica]UYK07692.1 hypothetical protein N4218_07770 [Yersinia enterocolitica]HDL7453377.1 hypothetical protein [Yersinia enterocolitica]HEN3263723.1 hypothetical protein [Yersinia enterocolitica]HEN3388956.1 hypothetical protein [Yersinia enterocolitica]